MTDILRRLRPDTENLPPWFLVELQSLAARCGHLSPAEQRALARQVLTPRAQAHLRTLSMRARIAHRMLTGTAPAHPRA
jgi:hypothetical protein